MPRAETKAITELTQRVQPHVSHDLLAAGLYHHSPRAVTVHLSGAVLVADLAPVASWLPHAISTREISGLMGSLIRPVWWRKVHLVSQSSCSGTLLREGTIRGWYFVIKGAY